MAERAEIAPGDQDGRLVERDHSVEYGAVIVKRHHDAPTPSMISTPGQTCIRHRAQFDHGVKIDLPDFAAGREVRGRQSGEAKRRDAGYPVGRDRLAQLSEQEARVTARRLMRIVAADLQPPERGVSASKAAHQQRR